MLNFLVTKFLGRKIILMNPHRNSDPVRNVQNGQQYIFLDPNPLWKATFVFGRNTKMRYRAMALFISLISPSFIIDINWITKLQTLYFVWCRNSQRKFVVIQHGAYVAGLITDIPHRYTKCQMFLTWSEYWSKLIASYNVGKQVSLKVFGNPVFNALSREEFEYSGRLGNKVLFAPSLLKGSRYDDAQAFIDKLSSLKLEVTLKEHNYQKTRSKSLHGAFTTNESLISLLRSKQFDYVITDVSSAMCEIIFTKNRAIFFSPQGNESFFTDNVYAKYFRNLALAADELEGPEDLSRFVDVNAQEELLRLLVQPGNNTLSAVL